MASTGKITRTHALAALLLASLAATGCTSSRISALDTARTAPGPAPLTPAPSGQVSSGQLPPPVQPGVQSAGVDANGFPIAPQTATPAPTLTPTPTDTPVDPTQGSVQQVATAAPVTKEALVGAWKVTTEGSSCQMFMALTKWSSGFRAASRGCPGDAANVSAWNVSGQQVLLTDTNGNRVATLFSSGNGRFDGQTTGGRAISLSR